MATQRIVTVIPARYASTRFPGKPLHPIAGKPLIQWVYEHARAVSIINEVFVATDDTRIYNAVLAFGGRAVMTSDRARSGSDRIAEAVTDMDCDIIVNLQGDEPLMRPETIERALRELLEDPYCQVATACVEIRLRSDFESPHNVKVVFDRNNDALYFSRSPIPSPIRRPDEDLKDGCLLGYKHLGMYVYRKPALMMFSHLPMGRWEDIEKLEQLRYIENGERIRVVVTKHDSPGVDTPEEVEPVETLLRAWRDTGQ